MAFFPSTLAAILVVTSGTAFAARWSGINTGLPTASPGVRDLLIDPATPSTLYALTSGEFIYKTNDAGATWRPAKGIVGVYSLAIDPRNSSTIYAATTHGVVKSSDGGQTWNSAGDGLTDSYPYSLTISPVDSSMLYAVTSTGIFKSTNAGASWSPSGSSPSSTTGIFGPLVIDPITPSTIYAPQSGRGLVKSTDGGESWTAIHPALDTDYTITSLAIDPVNSSNIYAGFLPLVFIPAGGSPTGGVLKSLDGGQTWTASQAGMPATFFVTSLAVDPGTPSTIYGVVTSNTGGGIVKSTDSGQSWSVMNDGLPDDFQGPLAIDPSSPSTVYAGYAGIQNSAIFKTTQGGASWRPSDTGFAAADARALAIDPVNIATLYAGIGDAVFKKTGSGAAWTKLASFELHNSFSLLPGGPPLAPPGPAYPHSIAIDFRNPDVLYTWAARNNGCIVFDRLLFKSSDSGATWDDSASPSQNPCVVDGFLVMDPTDPSTIYIVESDGFDGGYWVRKTVDAGATWSDIWNSDEFGPNALLIDPANHDTLYAGAGGGLFKSTDGGATWNSMALKDANISALALDPADGSTLYAATAAANYNEPQGFRGLFKSIDAGATWAPADSGLAGLTSVGAVVTSLLVDTSNRKLLYAGTSGDGVYKSADGGASWLKFNDGLSNLQIRALVMANSLYAATAGGIFNLVDETAP